MDGRAHLYRSKGSEYIAEMNTPGLKLSAQQARMADARSDKLAEEEPLSLPSRNEGTRTDDARNDTTERLNADIDTPSPQIDLTHDFILVTWQRETTGGWLVG